MRDEGTHPVVLVLAGIGVGALLAALASYLLRPDAADASPDGVRRAAARLRRRADDLARRVRDQTAHLVETGRAGLEEALHAGQQAADDRRRELESELHST